MLACELARHAEPVLLHVHAGTSHEPRHFARVRSDNQQLALAAQLTAFQVLGTPFECVQPICVENDGNIALTDQPSYQLGSLGKSRNSGPNRQAVLALDKPFS